MKSAPAILLSVVMFLYAAPAFAGFVQIGLAANDDEFDAWLCGGSMPPQKSQSQCGTAKFKECASCETIVISNGSDHSIHPDIEVSGPGFSQPGGGALGVLCAKPGPNQKGRTSNSCYSLAPGDNCYANIDFCPEQSGVSRGQVKVRVGDNSQSMTFTMVGTADYSPALQAADAVRKRHVSELMKIPKVHEVYLDQSGDKILIDVEVERNEDGTTPDDIKEVRRKVPATIEGYQVEVTEFTPVSYLE
ncbi:MAG: hypothetical protein ACLQDV_25385 [Candidatus Binataceae bacterium]